MRNIQSDCNFCSLPSPLPPEESKLYQRILATKCEAKYAAVQCHGTITIDCAGVTLRCALCGDARMVFGS